MNPNASPPSHLFPRWAFGLQPDWGVARFSLQDSEPKAMDGYRNASVSGCARVLHRTQMRCFGHTMRATTSSRSPRFLCALADVPPIGCQAWGLALRPAARVIEPRNNGAAASMIFLILHATFGNRGALQ